MWRTWRWPRPYGGIERSGHFADHPLHGQVCGLGYDLYLSSVDPDAFMITTIYVAQGVMDQLVDFFKQTIERTQMEMRMT